MALCHGVSSWIEMSSCCGLFLVAHDIITCSLFGIDLL